MGPMAHSSLCTPSVGVGELLMAHVHMDCRVLLLANAFKPAYRCWKSSAVLCRTIHFEHNLGGSGWELSVVLLASIAQAAFFSNARPGLKMLARTSSSYSSSATEEPFAFSGSYSPISRFGRPPMTSRGPRRQTGYDDCWVYEYTNGNFYASGRALL